MFDNIEGSDAWQIFLATQNPGVVEDPNYGQPVNGIKEDRSGAQGLFGVTREGIQLWMRQQHSFGC